MAILVGAVRTTYTKEEVILGLIKGWIKAFNTLPKKESIGVLYAQNGLETGGTKALWNNNFGNFKFAGKPDDGTDVKYMKLTGVWEIIGGKKVILDKENPGAWFRAFDTLEEGIAFHLDHLKNQRYKTSWVAVEAGDVKQFAHLLKVKMYYTASEEDYAKGMKTWFDIFMKDKTYDNFMSQQKTSYFDIAEKAFD